MWQLHEIKKTCHQCDSVIIIVILFERDCIIALKTAGWWNKVTVGQGMRSWFWLKSWMDEILFFKISPFMFCKCFLIWTLIGLYLFLSNVIGKITFASISMFILLGGSDSWLSWGSDAFMNLGVSLMHLGGFDSPPLSSTSSDEVGDDISPLKPNHLKSCKHWRAFM